MLKRKHHYIYIYLVGILFGFGLVLSEMIYPQKVIGFLDIFGDWDPSLVFVMIGGVAIYASFYFFTHKKTESILGYIKRIPDKKNIDRRLVTGSVLFGVGWGLAGLCPGPALVVLGAFSSDAFLFVFSMLGGMILAGLFAHK